MIMVRCAFDSGARTRELRFPEAPRVGEFVAFPNFGPWVDIYGEWKVHSVLWTPAKGDRHMECAVNLVSLKAQQDGDTDA